MHTAETSLDYQGTYRGTLPAADCPGIEVTLRLKPGGAYEQHLKYIGRDAEFDEKGGYTVRENLLTLTPADGEQPGILQGRGEPPAPPRRRKTAGHRRAGGQLRTAKTTE